MRRQGFAPLSFSPSLPLWPTVPAVSRHLRTGVDSRNCLPGINITAGPSMTLTHGKARQTSDYKRMFYAPNEREVTVFGDFRWISLWTSLPTEYRGIPTFYCPIPLPDMVLSCQKTIRNTHCSCPTGRLSSRCREESLPRAVLLP